MTTTRSLLQEQSGHARKTVLADLRQTKESNAVTKEMMQTHERDLQTSGCARDAYEPHHTSVIAAPRRDRRGCARIVRVVCNVRVFCATSLGSEGKRSEKQDGVCKAPFLDATARNGVSSSTFSVSTRCS